MHLQSIFQELGSPQLYAQKSVIKLMTALLWFDDESMCQWRKQSHTCHTIELLLLLPCWLDLAKQSSVCPCCTSRAIQKFTEAHLKLLLRFVPPVCLSFLAQGIANEDRFKEHEEIRVKAQETEICSLQLRASQVWHSVKAKNAVTWAGAIDFFQRLLWSWARRGKAGEANSSSLPDRQEWFHQQYLMSRKITD